MSILSNVTKLYNTYGVKLKTDMHLLLMYWRDIDGVGVDKSAISTPDFLSKTTTCSRDILQAKLMWKILEEDKLKQKGIKHMNKSPLKWVGGKSKLIKKLLPIFPKHKGYVEVFGGSAIMLLNKDVSKWEILNDFDSNLMNFWSVVQNAHDQLIKSFEWEVVSRERFQEYKEKYKTNNYDDAIERAKVFYYLVKAGFGADMKNPVFGTGKDRNRLRVEQVEQSIKETHERIHKVTIENKSFEDLFRIYDSEDTFFYLDPPYRNTKQYATGKFTDEQYELMRDCCASTKGKWLITINNDDHIRELFQEFNIMDHEVFYSVCKTDNGRTEFKELIITNYDVNFNQ